MTVNIAYEILNSFEPHYFHYKDKDGNAHGDRQFGFYSQDIHGKMPEGAPHTIFYDEDDEETGETWGVYNTANTGVHHVIIKDQEKRIVYLEKEIELLKDSKI